MQHFHQYFFSEADQDVVRSIKPKIYESKQAVCLIDETFTQSLKERLAHCTDEKIGVMLSGGVDSSLLVAMLKTITPKPIICFTAVTKSNASDKTPSMKIAKKFNVKWVQCIIDKNTLTEKLIRILPLSDGGLYDTAANLALDACLSKCKEYGVKTLWTGNGLDMFFGGGISADKFTNRKNSQFHDLFWEFSLDLIMNRFFYNRNKGGMKRLLDIYNVNIEMPFENLKTIIAARSIDAGLFFKSNQDKYPIRLVARKYKVPLKLTRRKKEALQDSSGIFLLLRDYMYDSLPQIIHDAVNFELNKNYFIENQNTDLQIFLKLLKLWLYG